MPGACIDPALIENLVGTRVSRRKDPSQRKTCRCVVSRDIGAYDTCAAGCVYCYAVGKQGQDRADDAGKATETGQAVSLTAHKQYGTALE
jgi:hypothetical protein